MIILPFGKRQDLAIALLRLEDCLRNAGVVLMPTETFYGLAADPFCQEAVDRVLKLKGRPRNMALPVLAADWDQVERLVVVPEVWRSQLETVWPGPMTVVLASRVLLPASPEGTVAVRIPGHSVVRALLKETGPLTGTSANAHGDRPAVDVDGALKSLAAKPDLVLDGGRAPGGQPSTLVDLTGAEIRILRQGAESWIDS